MCGQAYGAEQYGQLGLMLQRGGVIMTIFCIPISLLWLKAEDILLLWHQEPAIAALAGQYMLYLIPGLVASAWLYPVAEYIQSQVRLDCPCMLVALSSDQLRAYIWALQDSSLCKVCD